MTAFVKPLFSFVLGMLGGYFAARAWQETA
jgi:hypothetical protein